MAKQSAGLLVYRHITGAVEVLLVHPGGPFWAKKDKGAWSIPKGEFEDGNALAAAQREFQEELGHESPTGEFLELGSVKNKSGKTIHAWAIEGDLDASNIKSNTFTMEWPPKSGQQQEFVEVDKAGWFTPEKAIQKLNTAQVPFIEQLIEFLGLEVAQEPQQTTLL